MEEEEEEEEEERKGVYVKRTNFLQVNNNSREQARREFVNSGI